MTWTEIVLTSRHQRVLGVTVLRTKALRCSCPSSSCFAKAAHTCYVLLHVGYVSCYVSATCPATYQLSVGYKAAGPVTFWDQGMRLAHVRSLDEGPACGATPKLTPLTTLRLTPSWTLVKEGIWTTSTPIWLTCLTCRRTKRMQQMSTCDRRRRTPGCSNRMSWIGSASFPAKVSGANGLLDSWGSPATPSAVISLEPRSAFKNVLRRGASTAPRSVKSTNSSVPLPRETPSSFSRNWPPEGSRSTCGPCNGPWRPCVRRNGPGRWPLSGSRPHRANRSRSTSVKRSSRSPVSPSRFI